MRPDVQAWARAHLADATVEAMAHHAGVSPRTLNRQFRSRTGQSPQAWLQGLRLDTAAALLETTDLSVEATARQVGFGTATNLRAQFAGVYGVPPTAYRNAFGAPVPSRSERGPPAHPNRPAIDVRRWTYAGQSVASGMFVW